MTAAFRVDADKIKSRLDLVEFVGQYVTLAPSGGAFVGLCPFHKEEHPSFTVYRERGLWHCFGCEAHGDVFDFLQKIENVDFKEALQRLAAKVGGNIEYEGRRESHHSTSDSNTRTPDRTGLTVTQYSKAKAIPIGFLQDLDVSDSTYSGAPAVRIPYLDTDGTIRAVRFRLALEGENRFRWRSKDKPLLYGLPRLDRARKAGHVALVEGESDCHTLWHHDVLAVGLPGALTWREEWAGHFDGIGKIYIVIEDDAGGEGVLRWLGHSSIRERALLVRLGEAKDPSELYLSSPDEFVQRWRDAVDSAVPWRDVEHVANGKNADEAYALAKESLYDKCLLDRVGVFMQERGYAGDLTPPLLVYLALTSRLLERPINLALVAPSAAGKNRAIDAALELVPPESVHVEKAGSARALIYCEESFEHRVIVVAEADSIPDDGSAASAVRSIVEDDYMTYDVVEKDPRTGEHRTRRLTKPGPTGLITTSTRSVSAQLGTRMLEVPMQDDEDQTRAVLRAQARSVLVHEEAMPDAGPLLAVQRWLEFGGERRVVVPFAEALAELVPTKAVRMRRDFCQLLMCIKAVALLYQCQRARTPEGAVIASTEDYDVARWLLASIFQTIASEGLTKVVRETVEAVPVEGVVTVTELAARLSHSKSTLSYRVKRAIHGGWLVNEEARKGYPARLRRGEKMPDEADVLPTPERVCEVFEEPLARTEPAFERVCSKSLPHESTEAFACSTHPAEGAMPPPPAVTGDEVHLSSDENCKSCGHRTPRWSLSGSGCCPHCGTRDLTLRPEAQ
jgi:hypothetical protein